jgi:5'-nucleotidase
LHSKTDTLILITNDDGATSPGLLAAARSVIDLGEVWIAAPNSQRSGLGRSFPSRSVEVHEDALLIAGVTVPVFSLDASPAEAVRHALLRFLPRLPDLAISGVNYGENVGGSVTISGTIGAAIEAASFGIPTLAASLQVDQKHHFSLSDEVDFQTAGIFVQRFARWILAKGMPTGVDILKLEVPSEATPDTPWRMTRVSRQPYWVSPVVVDSRGDKHLRGYVRRVDFDRLEPDSDIYALAVDKIVSLSPLTTDLTARVNLQDCQQILSAVGPTA